MNQNYQTQTFLNKQNLPPHLLNNEQLQQSSLALSSRLPSFRFILVTVIIIVIIIIMLIVVNSKETISGKNQLETKTQLTDIFNPGIDSQIYGVIEQLKSIYQTIFPQIALARGIIEKKQSAIKLEYKYYNWKYNISSKIQKPICIVASQRNNMAGSRQQHFLDSVRKLNYSQYRLILIDDQSEDNTIQFTYQYINQFKQFSRKVQFVTNQNRKYSLANKIYGINNYCHQSDIIVDVDADDYFIGSQILHIINKIYDNSDIWFFYTNYLTSHQGNIIFGKNINLSEIQIQNYRTSNLWLVSHLKTYRKQLFIKLKNQDWISEIGQIYEWAADRFIIYGLLELAGIQHTHFQQIYPYFYNQQTNQYRNFDIIKPDKLRSMMVTPYKPLKSLSDSSEKLENYQIPIQLKDKLEKAIKKADILKSKIEQKQP